jgi:hypothetical protein
MRSIAAVLRFTSVTVPSEATGSVVALGLIDPAAQLRRDVSRPLTSRKPPAAPATTVALAKTEDAIGIGVPIPATRTRSEPPAGMRATPGLLVVPVLVSSIRTGANARKPSANPGSTAFDGADAAPVPPEPLAVTVNV